MPQRQQGSKKNTKRYLSGFYNLLNSYCLCGWMLLLRQFRFRRVVKSLSSQIDNPIDSSSPPEVDLEGLSIVNRQPKVFAVSGAP